VFTQIRAKIARASALHSDPPSSSTPILHDATRHFAVIGVLLRLCETAVNTVNVQGSAPGLDFARTPKYDRCPHHDPLICEYYC
jgi:hypothetical protein